MKVSERKWINYVSLTFLSLLAASTLLWTAFADLYKIPLFIIAYIFPYVFLFAMDQPILWVTYFIIISIPYLPMMLFYFSATNSPGDHSNIRKTSGVILVCTWFILVTIAIVLSHAH